MKHFTFSIFVLGFCSLLISACTNQYAVNTNLDKENFSQYFSPASVTIYQNEQEFTAKYKSLGGVEGESCQRKAHHELPNEIDARTQARSAAYQLGANAIIFSGCTLIEDNQANKQCIRTRVCYGRAFFIDNKHSPDNE
ncbi:Rcs stress response system protein RcsF [Thalassotalea sp. 1_MG-2023]|uniref:Rcs stress response system protein RcsF n=1 Tax=Thalassotalea sp. 1_MG-2023 TaxID=3062680 RepID=UPI0026E2EDB5|nr:Rcs stress response system protein RcsF [Thalassotalea sp. 1_MG-2023]MDO6428223.1 Rcs stress response system protein RcsF [Thalassotalea sp. 1_MG-2023]